MTDEKKAPSGEKANPPSEGKGIQSTVDAAEKALAEFTKHVAPEENSAKKAEDKATGPASPVDKGTKTDPTPKARPNVVSFEHVSKVYGQGTRREFTAINDVNFVVEDLPGKGEFICLLGPSGCGKSTVLRLIAGLEPQHPATTGTVLVFGEPVMGPGADRGMVFQSYTSFDNRTVLQNVAFGLECRGVPAKIRDDEARAWIAKVGLSVDNDAQKYPHELSGGMQQRVAIARTLILKPRIILMDEPFGALDPLIRSSMQDMIVSLWHEVEATVFFITHSIEEAVYLGDRAYIFSNSPGTILREFKLPPPDRPSKEMSRSQAFQEVVYELRDLIEKLESQRQPLQAAPGG